MEYLLATFLDSRTVIVDNKRQGMTNKVIELEEGHHVVRLDIPPANFSPSEIPIQLEDTNPLSPLEVHFEKV